MPLASQVMEVAVPLRNALAQVAVRVEPTDEVPEANT